jgi:serine/threonine-protein kinase
MGLLDNYRIKKSINKLISLQGPGDPEMKETVARLQLIGQPVIPYLLDELKTSQSHDYKLIVAALSTFVNDATLTLFISHLLNSPARVVNGLLDALTQRNPYDPNQLLSLFANPTLPGTKLEQLFQVHKDKLQTQALIRTLSTATKDNQITILRLVEQVATEESVPQLLQLLHTSNATIRINVVRTLRRFQTPTVQESLTQLISDPHKQIRMQALEVLVSMNSPLVAGPLYHLLHDPDTGVQQQAFDIILRMLQDDAESNRQKAVEVLNTVGNVNVLQHVLLALKSKAWLITQRVAETLGIYGNTQLIESVLSLLHDTDRFLSQCAFEIIHALKDEQTIQAVMQALQDPALRERVTGALTTLGDKRTGPFFIRMLERDTTSILIATKVLVALNNQQAIPQFLMQLSNPNEAIVKETLRALAILTTIEHASEVLNSVMATRDKSENEIKELANKIATSIIKRFGRKVLPQNSVQQSSNSLTPLGISLTASSTTPVPKTSTDNPKPKATLNLALLEPGVMLADRYRIIRRVGEGGFSTVFLVEDTMVYEEVILKILNPQIAMGDEMIKRFIQELRYARKVTHENIIRIYDIIPLGRSYAISMEYFPSHTLADELQGDVPLNIKRGIKIIFDVCRGISVAHQLKIVHRDLKPLNILINDQSMVKVVDFGVAAVTNHAGTRLTRVGTLLGTPAYVAPEQVRSRNIDARTDIYSLGVVMYEAFTGSPPYTGDDMSILFQHVEGNLTHPIDVNSTMPPDLDKIIRKAMSVDPDQRFQNVDQLGKSLVDLSRQLS